MGSGVLYEGPQRVLNDYRGPAFLAVEWFGSSPTPSHPTPISKLDRRHTWRLRKGNNLLTADREEGGWRGAESYDPRKKTWSLINHSILCGRIPCYRCSGATSMDTPRLHGLRIEPETSLLIAAGRLALPFSYSTPCSLVNNRIKICTVPSARSVRVGWAILAVVDRLDQELNTGQLGDQRRQILKIIPLMGQSHVLYILLKGLTEL